MRPTTKATFLLAMGLWIAQGTVAHAEGGQFGSGGFHAGSIGNAGNVGRYGPVAGGYSGYAYQVGPTGFEGGGSGGSSSGGTEVYHGRDSGPPVELEDGRGVYLTHDMREAEGPSWDTDWWSQDPRAGADPATSGATDLTLGTVVESLPRGHDTLYSPEGPYYFHEGTYYQAAESGGYRVVVAPIGIEVEHLPSAAELVEVDRKQYFVYEGTYYQALFGGYGIVYKVVDDPST